MMMIDDQEDPPMDDENFDDFGDSSGFDDEESFDDFDDGKETTLADVIREKPIVKIGLVAGVLILLYIGFTFFIGEDVAAPSSVPTASEVAVAPGTQQDVPENIRAAIEESDEQRREFAEQTGQSALPTLIEPPAKQLIPSSAGALCNKSA